MGGSMPITPAWQWSDRIEATGHASLPMRFGLLTAIAALHLSLALGLMHYRSSPAPVAGGRTLSVGMVVMAAPVRDAHPHPVVPTSGAITPAERRNPEPVVRRKPMPVPVVARHGLLAERRLTPAIHKTPDPLSVQKQINRKNAMAKNLTEPVVDRAGSSPSVSSLASTKGHTPVDGAQRTAARFDADYLDNPRPAYPTFSQRLREQGRVLLKVRVTRSGVADSVTIARSSGYPRLDDSALATVRHWRFIPARQGDQALDSWVLVPVTFSLRGEA